MLPQTLQGRADETSFCRTETKTGVIATKLLNAWILMFWNG